MEQDDRDSPAERRACSTRTRPAILLILPILSVLFDSRFKELEIPHPPAVCP
jgi:hypothetical protein